MKCCGINEQRNFWILIMIHVWKSQKWKFMLHDLCSSTCVYWLHLFPLIVLFWLLIRFQGIKGFFEFCANNQYKKISISFLGWFFINLWNYMRKELLEDSFCDMIERFQFFFLNPSSEQCPRENWTLFSN